MSYDERHYEKVSEALRYVRSVAGDFQPKTAVVLGSGLGKIAERVEKPQIIE